MGSEMYFAERKQVEIHPKCFTSKLSSCVVLHVEVEAFQCQTQLRSTGPWHVHQSASAQQDWYSPEQPLAKDAGKTGRSQSLGVRL